MRIGARVTDPFGASATVTSTVQVVAPVPSIQITSPQDGSQFFASMDSITFTAVTSNFVGTLQWDFGDGFTDTGSTVYYTYFMDGFYTVTVTGTPTGGGNTITDSINLLIDPYDVGGGFP